MRQLIILLAIIVVSCNNKKGNTNNMIPKKVTILSDVPKKNAISSPNFQIYLVENDSIMQSIEIKSITKKELSFVIVSKNKRDGYSKHLEGIASISNSSDLEFEEDEEGNALPVTEYIYKNNSCWISIKIDLEKEDFIKLKESECSDFTKKYSLNTGLFLLKKN